MTTPAASPMTPTPLDAYHRYLELINAHRFGDVTDLVHATVTVNGHDVSREVYVGGMVEDTSAIPDLHWSAAETLTTGETVAVRYVITGMPVRPWRGISPTGLAFAMQELIFYHFRDGMLYATWSLVDVEGARAQLRETAPTRS